MRAHPNRYANEDGPPRAIRNLDDYTSDTGRHARALNAQIEARKAEETAQRAAIPDIDEVSDRVLAPLRPTLKTVPRRLAARVDAALAERGETAGKVKADVIAHRVLFFGPLPLGALAKAIGGSTEATKRAVGVLIANEHATTDGDEDNPTVALTQKGRRERPPLSRDPEYERKRLAMAARFLAQDAASEDQETSLACLLRAALLWEPQGGWKAHAPRGPRREGFVSLRHLLASAFEDVTLGVSAIPLEVAQNRARTRSLEGEVFVQASHSSSGRARNASALDRQIDAQAVVFRSAVDLGLVPLLFERHVMGKHTSRDAMLDELQRREARQRRVMLPARPSKGATDSEFAAWRLACGLALWGEAPDQEQHNRKHDGALLRAVRDAEDALRKAMGLEVRKERPARPSRISEAGYANA